MSHEGEEYSITGNCSSCVFSIVARIRLFDYKDISTAALALMALYAAVGLLETWGEQTTGVRSFAGLLGLATVLSGGIKIAAIGLLLPAWVAAVYVLLRRGRLATLALLGGMTVGGVLVVTPMSWFDPLEFAAAAVRHMADHPWARCTMTFGECMAPRAADWPAGHYLTAWLLAQMPVLVGLGAIGGLVLAVRRGAAVLTIAASVVFPIMVILALNSTLYSGLLTPDCVSCFSSCR